MVVRDQLIEMHAGTSHTMGFTIVDAAGAAKSLADLTFTFAIARLTSDGVIVTASPPVDLSSVAESAQFTVVDESGGLLDVELLVADTSGLDGDYAFQCEATDGSSNPVMVSEGTYRAWRNIANA